MVIKLVAFQGPSASGKSTLQSVLGLPRVVTWTSRSKRDGEHNGKDYYFTTKERILEMFNRKELLEVTEYKGNYYGTSIESIQNIAESDNPSTIVVDVEGAKKLRKILKDKLLLIGIVASFEECSRRLE